MIKEVHLKTNSRTELKDITNLIEEAVVESAIQEGICFLFVPHTTAGITINEHADRHVVEDIRTKLDKMVPFDENYKHTEGNAAAHIKSSIIGVTKAVFISNGHLVIGTWQGIFFCEFDGPRNRKVIIKIMKG